MPNGEVCQYKKKLGRIKRVVFGAGGYQDACFGLTTELGGIGWGVVDFKGPWDPARMPHTEHHSWTEEDRDRQLAELGRYVSKLLKEANVDDVADLKGVPVEVTFDDQVLKEWRILTEVI